MAIDYFQNIHIVTLPQPPRKVFMSTLCSNLNEIVCVDHFFVDDTIRFREMDTSTRNYNSFAVESTAFDQSLLVFQSFWISQLCSLPFSMLILLLERSISNTISTNIILVSIQSLLHCIR